MGWPTEREFQGHGVIVVVDRRGRLIKRVQESCTQGEGWQVIQ